MATIRKRGTAQWEVRIRRKGWPVTCKTFETKATAEAWARAMEREMDAGVFIPRAASENTTVAQALERYKEEVFPRLSRGGKPLISCMNHLIERLGHFSLAALDSSHIAKYRDVRLGAGIGPQTLRHEIGLLNRTLKACQTDWNIPLPRGLVTQLVRLPSLPRGRDRRFKPDEPERLLDAAEAYGGAIKDIILFAMETAMRREEIARMRWEHMDWTKRVLDVPDTKTKTPRRVPLSKKAVAILQGRGPKECGRIWDLEKDSITRAFERVCARAEIVGLRFHDLRHEGTSRLFEKGLETMQVATVTGHKTLSMLKRYTHLKAEDLVDKLG